VEYISRRRNPRQILNSVVGLIAAQVIGFLASEGRPEKRRSNKSADQEGLPPTLTMEPYNEISTGLKRATEPLSANAVNLAPVRNLVEALIPLDWHPALTHGDRIITQRAVP
jgi:hypothetical protein